MDLPQSYIDLLVDFRGRFPISSIKGLSGAEVVVALLLVPLATLLAWFTISWATSPLRGFPGPFLAGQLPYSKGADRYQF